MNPRITRDPSGIYTIAVGPWPTMVARLLLATAESDADSRLSTDLTLARRLATLLGEGAAVEAAFSRLLLEPTGEHTIPYVEVELGPWRRMRAVMLIRTVEVMGSIASASLLLDIPAWRMLLDLWRARRQIVRWQRGGTEVADGE